MEDVDSRLSYINRKIVKTAKRRLPQIAEKHCPEWSGGRCRETGEPCDFLVCPLVDRIAGESGVSP